MHPKSKDRKGNEKLFAHERKDRREAKRGPGTGDRFRHSKYGAKLAALRAKKLGIEEGHHELESVDEEEG